MTDLQNSRFYDLLPPNLRNAHTAALSHALDRQMRELAAYISITLLLAGVANLREDLCDQTALQFNISEYRLEMDLDTKREMIRFAFQISARKGTAWAVDKLIATIFGSGHAEEWFDYGGDPYFFRIITHNMLAGETDFRDFMAAVYETKNTRSWLEAIILELRAEGKVYTGVAVHDIATETSRLLREAEDLNMPPTRVHTGMAVYDTGFETARLLPDLEHLATMTAPVYTGMAVYDTNIETVRLEGG